MLIEIWCANIKQHMKKKIQICVSLCLSVPILPLHDTSLCGSFSLLPSLAQSHLDTAAILLFSYLPLNNTLSSYFDFVLFCFYQSEYLYSLWIYKTFLNLKFPRKTLIDELNQEISQRIYSFSKAQSKRPLK